MRWRYIINVVGVLTIFLGLTMIVPLVVGLYFNDQSVIPILKSIGITICSGFLLHISFRKAKAEFISQREGIAIVAVGWTVVG
ncbi:MAG: TrkH family potassium uptake protein, partial [Desulfobacteraceae bacterium]|nr:TrkH family potassium uptake protein [Desulfobacteraceae bacterium]